jgi:hypothetical protein
MPFNKPDITQLSALGSTTGDVYFPQTKLLLPFDGVNGATTTSDSSNRNATVTFNGNASLSTAQSKFGGSSLYLDGTGDTVSITDTYWNTAIHSGDFTLELWVRFTVDETSNLIAARATGTSEGWVIQRYASGTQSGQILFYYRDSAGWQYLNYAQGTRTTISQNTWYHVAVTRNGNAWRFFLNGTQEDTTTNSNAIVTSTSGKLEIGGWGALDYPVTGYIEDVRITKGIARYTSNFTAPTTALPTVAGDVNKQILINSTADGVAIGTGGINQARIAKAWVNFNGTGTVAIRDNYNVSSITDEATGKYTVNFSTAMADANYSAVMYNNAYHLTGTGGFQNTYTGGLSIRTTTSLRLEAYGTSGFVDSILCDLIVFGN